MEPLKQVAADLPKERGLSFRLDAFGDHAELQFVTHGHHAAAQGPSTRGDGRFLHETPVDLYLVERELAALRETTSRTLAPTPEAAPSIFTILTEVRELKATCLRLEGLITKTVVKG